MRHPSEGVLRRLLDEPAGVADADRVHAAGCASCTTVLAAVRDDAARVGAALAPAGVDVEADVDVDVDAAWRRLSATVPAGSAGPAVLAGAARAAQSRPRSGRLRLLVQRPAVAAVAAVAVLAGAGTAAANGWLPVFRTEQVAPVSLRTADLLALPDLSAYGTLELAESPEVREVPSAAAAEAETGLDVPEVADLPRGVSGEPFVQVGDRVVATFTFSAERAARAAGSELPPVPPGLDGSAVRLEAGPGVVQLWTSDAGAPALVVGRAVAPSASSSGVPFAALRDYLLELPGLPADVAAQLRTFTADGTTLPLPVPADQVTTSSAEVGGDPATVLESRDRTFAGVVWVSDGVVTVVAGSLDVDEVLEVARGLR